MVITLTGMPGSGKSTVGRMVADLLGCRFLDLDEEIVRRCGKSIPDIFSTEGEAAFRKTEGHVLRAIVPAGAKESPVPTLVLALGGGTLMKPGSARLVHEETVCIYLRATLETLSARLAGEADSRPLLAAGPCPADPFVGLQPPRDDSVFKRLEKLLAERAAVYEETAHIILDTDGNDPGDIASEIIVTAL
jgi:shikimate kinase